MEIDNVKLWFARDQNNEIITISDINENNKHNKYICPMCSSNLIPKAIKSKQITSHFAHIDASKCNSETMIHFWFKNKFLQCGDKFSIVSDKERQYICKEVLVEQSYIINGKTYKPDITVITECNKTIYFEMKYSNKKQAKDYIDIWLELKNIVVEIDIKKLINRDKIPTFTALFYNGKCFNIKKNDLYYNIIGRYKEEKMSGKIDEILKKRLKKLDWFWNDILKYKYGNINIEQVTISIDSVENQDKDIIYKILRKPKCVNVYKDYINYKTKIIYDKVIDIAKTYYGENYKKYIGSGIRTDSYSKDLVGYIKVLDISDNCFILIDIKDGSIDSIKDSIVRYFEYNVKILKRKEIEMKKENTKSIILNSIRNNKDFKNIINNLNKKYKLDIFFRWDNLEVTLNFIDSGVVAIHCFEIDLTNSILEYNLNILEICNIINKNIVDYFNNLDNFIYADELYKIIKLLKNRYKNKSINIEGELWLEDRFEVNVFCREKMFIDINFYITNCGVLEGSRSENIIYKFNNIYDLEYYLINKISTEIRNKLYE